MTVYSRKHIPSLTGFYFVSIKRLDLICEKPIFTTCLLEILIHNSHTKCCGSIKSEFGKLIQLNFSHIEYISLEINDTNWFIFRASRPILRRSSASAIGWCAWPPPPATPGPTGHRRGSYSARSSTWTRTSWSLASSRWSRTTRTSETSISQLTLFIKATTLEQRLE